MTKTLENLSILLIIVKDILMICNIGGNRYLLLLLISVIKEITSQAFLFSCNYSVPLDKWNISDMACDYVFAGNNMVNFAIPGTLGIIYNYKTWLNNKGDRCYPFLDVETYMSDRTFRIS